jgi:hypothetical protein
MEQIGYSLVNGSNVEVQHWGDVAGQCAGVPGMIVLLNGDHVHCPQVGGTYGGLRLAERWLAYTGTEGVSFSAGKIIVSRSPPEPAQVAPTQRAVALEVKVVDGDIATLGGSFNFLAGLYLDVGQYMLLFCNPEPDTNYFVQVSGQASMDVVEKSTDYVIVSAAAGIGGAPFDAATFSIQVFRI